MKYSKIFALFSLGFDNNWSFGKNINEYSTSVHAII